MGCAARVDEIWGANILNTISRCEGATLLVPMFTVISLARTLGRDRGLWRRISRV